MVDKLKPGNMGSINHSTTPPTMPPEFENSMAAAIEAAFNTILQEEGKNTIEVNTNSREARDRRMMFVAIARGIVSHLVAHQAAFEIHPGGFTIQIQTE